jgi:hypothetical protein
MLERHERGASTKHERDASVEKHEREKHPHAAQAVDMRISK